MRQFEDGIDDFLQADDESESSSIFLSAYVPLFPQHQKQCDDYKIPKETEDESDIPLNCPRCHQIIFCTSGPYDFSPKEESDQDNRTLQFFSANNSNPNNRFVALTRIFLTGETKSWFRFCTNLVALLAILFVICCLLKLRIENDSGTNDGNIISSVHRQKLIPILNKNPLKLKRLPQCIIIGARKCGTRALIDMLNLHPQVEKATVEVHFFDRDDFYGKGLEWYKSQMPETTPDQLSIEKSPSYFVTPEVPERVAGMNSSIKLILIVREPVTRVISDYTQIYGSNPHAHPKSNNGTQNLQAPPRLEDLVLHPDGSINVHYKAIRISLYARYLQRWLDVFPLNQIQVIDGDELIRNPYSQLSEVEHFLGLHPRLHPDNFYFNATKGFYCWRKLGGDQSQSQIKQDHSNERDNGTETIRDREFSTVLHCLSDSKGRRHPRVAPQIVAKLRRFYQPHNFKFYDMVGRDFGWPEK